MSRRVVILGVGMTRIGKFLDKSLKDLTKWAIDDVIEDAGIQKSQIQSAYVGNVQGPAVDPQIVIKGQVWLRAAGIGDISVINTNNVCATGGTAINMAWQDVASGNHDCVLALGVEKMHSEDRQTCFKWLNSAKDMDEMLTREGKTKHGDAIGMFAGMAKDYIENHGLTKEMIANVCEKNHFNASLNPYAQYQKEFSIKEILASPVIVDPIHRSMCATIADGAAGIIVCSEEFARRHTSDPIYIAASTVRTAHVNPAAGMPSLQERCVQDAYQRAGMGPEDIDVWEVGDPTSFNEIMSYEQLGICKRGDIPELITGGATNLNGRFPVNPAGGHEGRGHPAAATGIAQVTELVWQLRGQAGKRQIKNKANVGLAHIYGGDLGPEPAAICTTIIKK